MLYTPQFRVLSAPYLPMHFVIHCYLCYLMILVMFAMIGYRDAWCLNLFMVQDIEACYDLLQPVIYMEMEFPPDYPMTPPFVRVLRPRFKFLTGW